MAAQRTSYMDILEQPGCQGKDSQALAQDAGLTILRTALDKAPFDRNTVNPFQRADGESLPCGTFRNHQGILVRGTTSFNLDLESQATVAQDIPFLSEHVVIAYVVDGDLQGLALTAWWDSLSELAAPGQVNFHRRVNPQVVYVRTDGLETTNQLLTRAFHQFNGGTIIYQRWIKGFNPRIPLRLLWPMWISFPELPLEYQKLSRKIAEQVGLVLAVHDGVGFDSLPRFCVGIDVSQGWTSTVVGYSEAGGSAPIPVHYDALELNCSLCGHHQHHISQCQRARRATSTQRAEAPRPTGPVSRVTQDRGGYPRQRQFP